MTSDLKVAELVESVSRVQKKDGKDKTDIVVLPVATGSNEYISFVKNATESIPAAPSSSQAVETDSQNTDQSEEKDNSDDQKSEDDSDTDESSDSDSKS